MLKTNKRIIAVVIFLALVLLFYAFLKMPSGIKLESAQDRAEYIGSLGYSIDGGETAQNVLIPEQFDAVYNNYNNLQKSAGMNLEKYRGKTAVMYTYTLKGYKSHEGTVYLHLLVYNDRLIGGDICSAEINGFMDPLK